MHVYTRTGLVFFRLPHQWLLTCPKVFGTCLRIKPKLNHLETSLIWMLLWIRSHYWQEVDQSFLNSKEHLQQPQPKGKSNEKNAVVDVDRENFSDNQGHRRQTSLFYWSISTEKSGVAAVDIQDCCVFSSYSSKGALKPLELKKLTIDVFQDFENFNWVFLVLFKAFSPF